MGIGDGGLGPIPNPQSPKYRLKKKKLINKIKNNFVKNKINSINII